jgi:deoxyribodipyrimidine photo-lyase
MLMYANSLFFFRRDLRLSDNLGLHQALASSSKVWACFCFDPRQLEAHPYRSDAALRFLVESLEDLQRQMEVAQGKLYVLYGRPHELLPELLKQTQAAAVFVNRDFTPFSQQRDQQMADVCQAQQAVFHSVDDVLLHPPEKTRKANHDPYTVFTPFYKNASKLPVPTPQALPAAAFATDPLPLQESRGHVLSDFSFGARHADTPPGGRAAAQQILADLSRFGDYQTERDFPAKKRETTRLSAHHKFGTVSVREVFHAMLSTLGAEQGLVRQLYWRDFFTQIAFHFPRVFGAAFQTQYDAVEWAHNEEQFAAWCEGRTGFPIVDAGMRELNATGYMHNRARMIVASFLTKDLHIDWRWGERYFAQRLVDYDPCVNNGSWQWAASTGCDAQPYFRIFNPWLQQQKFDAEGAYIHRWVPELRSVSPKRLHQWHKETGGLLREEYPAPIVDHRVASQHAKAMFAAVAKGTK